jgi:hypothetical protein
LPEWLDRQADPPAACRGQTTQDKKITKDFHEMQE